MDPAAPAHRKALGQHFLREPRIVRRILEAADVQPGERVLEIGPGDGVLTEPLLAAVGPGGRVVAFEVDARFAALLQEQGHPNLEVVTRDVLRFDLARMERFDRIVSNLPYQISGPVTIKLLDLLDGSHDWRVAVLMYQKEFADRLLAKPGQKAYGRLTVHAARRLTVEKIRDVSPACFQPPPKVASTVLRLRPHLAPPFAVRDETAFRALVDGTFQQRRKKLRNTAPRALVPAGVAPEKTLAAVEALGLADARPEELAPKQFADIVAAV